MPTPGNVLHQQLIQAHGELQHELEAARGEIAAAGAELGQLSGDRGDALLDLAQHYLPELSAEAVARTLPEIRQWVRDLLVRKQQHVVELDSQIRAIEEERDREEARLADASAELDAMEAKQEELAKKVSDKLAADPEFSALSNKAGEAEAALQRSEANLAEIEQDSLRKLPAYEKSSLFMYLWNRKFGTPEYQSTGITRSTDQWLARYIGFREARKGYEFLKTTPGHMREVIAEDRQALNLVMEELERRRDIVAKEFGLTDLLERLKVLSARRTEVVQKLETIEKRSQELQAERTRVDDTRGPYYQEAIQKFRDYLEKIEPRMLAERARSTPAVEDDLIVARLEGLTEEMAQVSEQVRHRQQVVGFLTQHLQSLGTLINRYRAAGFDSARALFTSHFDVLSELRQVREGRGSYEAFWQRLRKSHRWGPSPMDRAAEVAASPMTQILIHAMIEAAGAAMQSQVRQAGRRRADHDSPFVLRPPTFPGPFGGGGGGGGSDIFGGDGGFENHGSF